MNPLAPCAPVREGWHCLCLWFARRPACHRLSHRRSERVRAAAWAERIDRTGCHSSRRLASHCLQPHQERPPLHAAHGGRVAAGAGGVAAAAIAGRCCRRRGPSVRQWSRSVPPSRFPRRIAWFRREKLSHSFAGWPVSRPCRCWRVSTTALAAPGEGRLSRDLREARAAGQSKFRVIVDNGSADDWRRGTARGW